MPVSSELNQLITAHNLLGNAKYSLLEELDNVSFANDEVKAFVLTLADYTHDPSTCSLIFLTKVSTNGPLVSLALSVSSANPAQIHQLTLKRVLSSVLNP